MWPFPIYPPIPLTKKQIKEYERKQREKSPDAPF